MIRLHSLFTVALLSTLSACATLQYVSPSDESKTAKVRLELKDVSIIAGFAVLHQTTPAICSGGSENRRMISIGKGNPFTSDVNVKGVLIPANERIMFRLAAKRDGEGVCLTYFSILPRVGKEYVLQVINMRSSDTDNSCPLTVVETDGSSSQRMMESPDFTLDSCPGR